MPRRCLTLAAVLFPLAAILFPLAALGAQDTVDRDAVRRGEYVFRAAGCAGCHTDVKDEKTPLAGGRALRTPFGTFYGPNITPDPDYGIGGWALEDFTRALREGLSPDGGYYFPAFPYTSYSGMADDDIADLWVYLQTVAPSSRARREHDLDFPYGMRWLLGPWRYLYFQPVPFDADLPAPAVVESPGVWRRGAYLVRALAHCGECHTPRGSLGARDGDRELAGNAQGPDGDPAPNITPHNPTGIGVWSADDIVFYLEIGMKPDGDFADGAMAGVIEHSTGTLSGDDRQAIAAYLLSLPPVDRKIDMPKR